MSDERPDYGPRRAYTAFGRPVNLPELTDDQRHAVAVDVWEAQFGSYRSVTTGQPRASHQSLVACAHEADAAMAALIRLGFTIEPPKATVYCVHGIPETAHCGPCARQRSLDDWCDEECT
jgi:hypothetical protein